MEDRFLQQLKKGVLEMLVLELVCRGPTYGYELLKALKEGSDEAFVLKEGTLYPILYRLEDEGLIEAAWSKAEGRSAPKKMYKATEKGQLERQKKQKVWDGFVRTVNGFYGGNDHV